MLFRAFVAGFGSLALLGAAAAQDLPRLKKGTPYHEARTSLSRAGYKPVRLPGADHCERGDERCFPEAFACAGTGKAGCVYTWQRSAVVIDVLTVGESPVIERVRCRSGCR